MPSSTKPGRLCDVRFESGRSVHLPVRALVQRSIYDRFMERAVKRVEGIRQGDPYEMSTQIGAQASNDNTRKSCRT